MHACATSSDTVTSTAHSDFAIIAMPPPAIVPPLGKQTMRRFAHCREVREVSLVARSSNGTVKVSPSVGFIHVPKTGGTSFKDQSNCKGLYFGAKHADGEREWLSSYCMEYVLIVLREPADRFRSAFAYARYGSDKYAASKQSMANVTRRFGTAGEFVDALSAASIRHASRHVLFGNVPISQPVFGIDATSTFRQTRATPPHLVSARSRSAAQRRGRKATPAERQEAERSDAAWDILVTREFGIQFRAATWWLDAGTDTARRLIVCYSPAPSIMAHRMEMALSRAGVSCSFPNLEATNRRAMPTNVSNVLNVSQTKWIRRLYHDDWVLWNRHCKS